MNDKLTSLFGESKTKSTLVVFAVLLIGLGGLAVTGTVAAQEEVDDQSLNVSDGDDVFVDLNLTDEATEGDLITVQMTDDEGIETFSEELEVTQEDIDAGILSTNTTVNVSDETALSADDANPVTVSFSGDLAGVENVDVDVDDSIIPGIPDGDTQDWIFVAVVIGALVFFIMAMRD